MGLKPNRQCSKSDLRTLGDGTGSCCRAAKIRVGLVLAPEKPYTTDD